LIISVKIVQVTLIVTFHLSKSYMDNMNVFWENNSVFLIFVMFTMKWPCYLVTGCSQSIMSLLHYRCVLFCKTWIELEPWILFCW